MVLSQIFDRFVERTPVSVMARAAMEHAMGRDELDALFGEHAERQYTKDLLFSSVVDLMSVVVCKVQPSVHAAYQAVADYSATRRSQTTRTGRARSRNPGRFESS
jgi:hypothetical protein